MAQAGAVTEIVSAIVCVRDGVEHLAAALRSVLAEDDGHLEVVVVDDGSTDGSQELVAAVGLPVLSGPGKGVAAARMVGLGAATGTVVAFCDQDDLWERGRLSLQRGLLGGPGGPDAVVGQLLPFVDPGAAHPEWAPSHLFDGPRTTAALGTMLIRRSALDELGGFDQTLRLADDVDWMVRARERGRAVLCHDDVVLRYRIHERNQSADRAAMRAEIIGSLRRSIQRRRVEQP